MRQDIDEFCRTATDAELRRRAEAEQALADMGDYLAGVWVNSIREEVNARRNVARVHSQRQPVDAPALSCAY